MLTAIPFGAGGLTASLAGDVLTINTPQFAPGKIMQEAIFNINVPASVPEASTAVSFGLFMAGLMLRVRRRKTVNA